MYHRWYMVLCMHQIWYNKYTTCTGRMANVQWSIRPAQDVWLTYKAYSPCTPSIPYVSTVIYGYTGRILHFSLAIRQGQVVYLVYQIWYTHKTIHYRWYKGYTWWARTIRCVLQPYVLYKLYISLYVSQTSGTGRILRVPNLVHTLDHISPIIHRVYLVYTDYTLCTSAIRLVLVVWLTFNEVYNLYRTYG